MSSNADVIGGAPVRSASRDSGAEILVPNHQISTIQRLHIIHNTLINQSRKFSGLSAVCVPSSQRRHHTIEIVHIHRTSLVLLGTMMAI